jgi:hypothetical protein
MVPIIISLKDFEIPEKTTTITTPRIISREVSRVRLL